MITINRIFHKDRAAIRIDMTKEGAVGPKLLMELGRFAPTGAFLVAYSLDYEVDNNTSTLSVTLVGSFTDADLAILQQVGDRAI